LWRVLTIISNHCNNNKPIGFFDSGIGGLTVLSEFRKILPSENCIFFGDTLHMPYGEKTKEQLIEYSKKTFEFFESRQVKAVVMACNTTSAVVYEELKDRYNFKLYPLIQSVSKIIASGDAKTIGVFATPATINSKAYSKWINLYNENIKVIEIACPDWVKFVESNAINTPEAYTSIKSNLEKMLAFNPDKIILGCTHYPYMQGVLTEFTHKDIFINPAKDYVNFIKNDLTELNLLNNSTDNGFDEFYVSSAPENFIKSAKCFYDVHKCEILNLN